MDSEKVKELLRQKYSELGRMPTKADFLPEEVMQIKGILGAWPRALEKAGIKKPRAPKKNKQKYNQTEQPTV